MRGVESVLLYLPKVQTVEVEISGSALQVEEVRLIKSCLIRCHPGLKVKVGKEIEDRLHANPYAYD